MVGELKVPPVTVLPVKVNAEGRLMTSLPLTGVTVISLVVPDTGAKVLVPNTAASNSAFRIGSAVDDAAGRFIIRLEFISRVDVI